MANHVRNAALAAAAVLTLTLPLSACGKNDDHPEAREETATEATSADAETSTETEATTTTAASSSTTESGASSSSAGATRTGSTAASSSKSSGNRDQQTVRDVAEQFATLAPASLFEKLDTCSSTGIAGSYDCAGPEVGQFQFFDSDSKATSTAQLLTELRSSRVVEDSGDRLVGWSTLGTSAIITVVDVNKGQVLQQLMSSDQGDPRDRIYELGLADEVDHVSTPGGSTTRQSTTRTTHAAEPTTTAN